jgi:putative tricarboxylic transport membrane protein
VSARIHLSDAAIAAGLIALGVFFAAQTYALPDAPGYAQVGPRLFPNLVAAGLLVCGFLLLRQALSGGFRGVTRTAGDAVAWHPFAWVSVGVLAHMAIIGWVGFIAAAMVLFACVARAFGSKHLVRDIVVGAVLGAVVFFVFTQGLGLPLPSGLPSGKA